MRRFLFVIFIGGALMAWMDLQAGELPSPPPLANEPVAEQHYFQKIYDNWHRLVITTVNPNTAPARRGQRGELLYATFGGTNRLCVQTTAGPGGGTAWQCVSLTTP